MELTTVLALVIVLGFLLFSIAISLGIGSKITKLYEEIRKYIDRISFGTAITLALLAAAVLLAVIASM